MKVYLASTAPGNEAYREREMLPIHARLLSYFCIIKKQFENNTVFEVIKKQNNENK